MGKDMSKKTVMTIVRGLKKFVAVYKAGKLVYTADKHKTEEDINRSVHGHGGADCVIKECEGSFCTWEDIPETWKDASKEKKDGPTSAQTKGKKVEEGEEPVEG